MSEGQFTNTVPQIYLEPGVIEETIVEGEPFCGSFTCLCEKDAPTKGLIYCDHPYIFINTPAFNEENTTITYKISAEVLRAGDVLSGFFYIYSELSVRKLPFKIEVVKSYPSSSVGPIRSVEDFCELAKRSWKEAKAMFYSDEFKKLMSESPKDIRLLYRGFENASKTDANLDEFLTACGLKSRVYFELDSGKREYSFVSGNLKETIDITRNTWGYIRLEITSDADFVTVENNIITSDFFLGSKLSVNYYIHKELLHAGKNVCRITIKGMGIVRTIEIVASSGDLYEKQNAEYITLKKEFFKLYSTYESFRLKEIGGVEWAKSTIKIVDSLLDKDVWDRNFFRLIKTHALIVEGSRKMALEIVKNLRIDVVDKRSVNWAYLLYLGALLEPEEEYVNRLRREIELILDAHPEDVRVFWFLLFLRQEYIKDPSEKLRSIKHWINEGYDSPILYAECYEIFLEDTYLLDSLSEFNLKILFWANKRGGITETIAQRIFDLLLKENGFDKRKYKLFLTAYSILPNEVHLKHLASYLLKAGVKGKEFIDIYRLGIDSNLKLTGLFEAYVESLPLDYIEKLSDATLRYFSYNSNIGSERKALIYANIIMYKKEDPVIYDRYRSIIRDFCVEQMKIGRLDDNLAVCYQDLISETRIDSRIAEGLVKIVHAKKVICVDSDARKVLLYEDQLKDPVISNMHNHISFLPVFSPDYKIFIEKADGTLSCDDKIFYLEDTIRTDSVYDTIKELCEDKHNFFLHDFASMETSGDIKDYYEQEAYDYLFDDSIDLVYLKNHFHIFMSFFKNHLREDVILSALKYQDRYKFFENNVLTYMSNLLVIDGHEEDAIKLFSERILLNCDKRQLLNALKKIVGDGTVSKGEFVLELCIFLLRDGYHSDETIEYLLHHFIGRTEDMRSIFKYADPISDALNDFCERFIVSSLYSGTISSEDDNILISYLDKRPNPMIVEAYISYFSHLYLTEDKLPPDSVFAILIRQIKLTDSVNDSCRFAFCKYLCQKKELTRQEQEILDILLTDQIQRNIYFPFYSDMDEAFILKYHLYDRMYVSFKYEPKQDLIITVSTGSDKFEIDMPESYDGIYVKDIVIFFGETISYKVTKRSEPTKVLYSGEHSFQDISFLKESRFFMLNHMEENLFFKEQARLTEDIKDYNKKVVARKALFKSL